MASDRKYREDNKIDTKITSIWLEETEMQGLVMEYCGTCRAPMFKHGGHLVTKIEAESPSKLPFYLLCKNRDCGRQYKIHLMIKSVV